MTKRYQLFRVYSYTWSTYTNYTKERQQSQLYTKMKNNLNGRIWKCFFTQSVDIKCYVLNRFAQNNWILMMITGHTKFEPDWHFGIWKMHWRNSNVETITEAKFYSSFNLGWFGCFIVFSTTFNNIKWLMMFFKTRWRFSVISHRRAKPLRWDMTEKRPRVLKKHL